MHPDFPHTIRILFVFFPVQDMSLHAHPVFNRLGGVFQLITLFFSLLLLLHLLFHTFLAHLSMLNVSFWDRVMSVVWASETSVTSETAVRQLFACGHSRGHSLDLIYMKLREKVNLYKI